MSMTSLAEAIYAWPCESISRGRADSPHSRTYQGIDRKLVHTPLVPSGSWIPCTLLVWNQGFPTPVGGSSISTNPVKATDVHFSSSQFRKPQSYRENTVSVHVRAFREGERTLPPSAILWHFVAFSKIKQLYGSTKHQ
ncbi:unnamed protein product [Schistosoma curassoni]|uniref:Uncharacterized protein n=1 Tax=Schistosoma curassoni TaxID=6186 RepID=A0A183KHS5_9TREM|nr:unnamed protein product [Schistosoma curassoni]